MSTRSNTIELESASSADTTVHGNRPIRVCYLIDNLAIGGTEKQLLALIAHLDREKVEPYLCLLDGTGEVSQALEPGDCPVARLGVRSLRSVRAIKAARRFVRFLRDERIDIVQLQFPDSTYFGAPLARFAGVKSVIFTRRNLGYWLTPRHRFLGRLIGRFATATIANSKACRDAMISEEGVQSNLIHVIPNGVDIDRFADTLPSNGRSGADKHLRVGVVAGLRPVKNLDIFLRAARIVCNSVENVEFRIAGEGSMRPSLESLIQELGLDGKADLVGGDQDVPSFLAGLDVAVLCSKSESLSNALLEYMAAGKPIVATAVGGTAELLEHEKDGLLVPPDNVDGLAQAMLRLLRDRDFAFHLGTSARRRALHYGNEAMTRRHEQAYLELAGKSATRARTSRARGSRRFRDFVRDMLVACAVVLTAPLWLRTTVRTD